MAEHPESPIDVIIDLRERLLREELRLRAGGRESAEAAMFLHDTGERLAYAEYGEEKLDAARRQGRDEGFGNGFEKGHRAGYRARCNEEAAMAADDGVVVPLRAASA